MLDKASSKCYHTTAEEFEFTQSTLKHALKYIEDAITYHYLRKYLLLYASEKETLKYLSPEKPCAAFGLAKKMLSQEGSLEKAKNRLSSLIVPYFS